MKYILRALVFSLLLTAVASLSACGKMSAPSPIEGSGYPHEYPHR